MQQNFYPYSYILVQYQVSTSKKCVFWSSPAGCEGGGGRWSGTVLPEGWWTIHRVATEIKWVNLLTFSIFQRWAKNVRG